MGRRDRQRWLHRCATMFITSASVTVMSGSESFNPSVRRAVDRLSRPEMNSTAPEPVARLPRGIVSTVAPALLAQGPGRSRASHGSVPVRRGCGTV